MDDYPLLELFWTMLWFFLWIMWLFLLFKIISDIFRDHELSGWGKAGWLILCLLLPFIGVLVYVIVRGTGMTQRETARAREAEGAFQDYIRKSAGPQAGGSGADELARLADLKEKGALTEEEFQKAKAKILA
ncbi:SHOCT domain-containing protein [Streptomyces sp. NBC_00094]|uniref:SHOCT domain-containing protein n=1 Tax=Streptomyces sp. NBC_00094 TaxID=2903620 RepID=UPI002258588B|nr:SHOCT domain-containing protein [Streptomyces sp. NBC_00094]MCX5395238.1 SHOCT domain-containing protein [Streptomyces sp. NBC_00094]